MAKRFTDTNKYRKGFIRSLTIEQKVLWDYICTECDNAGVWEVELDIAGLRLARKGDPPIQFDESEIIAAFGDKIHVFDNGKKWFIPTFIPFQYGKQLNPKNNAHKSVIEKLQARGLLNEELILITDIEKNEGLISPSRGAMDMDKDKEMDMDKDIGKTEILSLVTFESMVEAWLNEQDIRLKQADRSAIILIREELKNKIKSGVREDLFNHFKEFYDSLAKDNRWWRHKRKDLTLLSRNFEEAYSVAFDRPSDPATTTTSYKPSKARKRS
tara:strand:- start:5330 stop:6142 length:813 start_codon:yes stop_codon:yes gene_type:complete